MLTILGMQYFIYFLFDSSSINLFILFRNFLGVKDKKILGKQKKIKGGDVMGKVGEWGREKRMKHETLQI